MSPESLMFTAKMSGTAIAVFFGICFLIGLVAGEEGGVEPLRLSDNVGSVYNQDLFAVATGNEEYLAAHCALDSAEELRREKEELQRMRNKLARMKLQKQMDQLQKSSQAKPKPQTNPLIEECVEAMVVMGEKKSSAKLTVNNYFTDNPNTKTVEEFISGVFKK